MAEFYLDPEKTQAFRCHLLSGFTWDDTSQGHSFWRKLEESFSEDYFEFEDNLRNLRPKNKINIGPRTDHFLELATAIANLFDWEAAPFPQFWMHLYHSFTDPDNFDSYVKEACLVLRSE